MIAPAAPRISPYLQQTRRVWSALSQAGRDTPAGLLALVHAPSICEHLGITDSRYHIAVDDLVSYGFLTRLYEAGHGVTLYRIELPLIVLEARDG